MVNLNVNQIYPYLKLVRALVICNSSGQPQTATDLPTEISENRNLLTDSDMEDAELIFSKSISFGVESNVNSEGDYLYSSDLYHLMIDTVSMTHDSDFTLSETKS